MNLDHIVRVVVNQIEYSNLFQELLCQKNDICRIAERSTYIE
jgi:hypothetical protein